MPLGLTTLLALTSALAPVIDGSSARRSGDGTIVAEAAPGLSPATQFQAGSVSKWACSVAILRFVDRERFSLHDRVVDVLPEFEGPENVRVRDLLANRSGLTDGLMPALRRDGPAAILSRDYRAIDAANAFAGAEPANVRDASYSYDLVNWILVQAILEHQSGEPIATVMDQELLGPHEADLPDSFYASGVPELDDAPEVAGDVMPLPAWLACAGGLVTTPTDLVRMMDWVANSSLSLDSLDALTSLTTPEEGYALGGHVRVEEGSTYFWLSGSNGAFKTSAAYRLDTREGFAAMTASGDTGRLATAKDDWFEVVRTRDPIAAETPPTRSSPQPATPRQD